MPPFTLKDLHDLARRWCPPRATWIKAMPRVKHWGAAHEIGHALLSTPAERRHRHYGLCNAFACSCARDRCYVVEIAAMRISHRLLTIAGHEEIAYQEYDDTDNIHHMETEATIRSSWLLLRRKRLWPLPSTRAGLERALQRRLRTPNTKPIRVSGMSIYSPLANLMNALL